VLEKDTVFLHGNLASTHWWRPSVDSLGIGDKKSLALLIDWQGCGQSDPPENLDDLSMESLTKDVVALMESLHLTDCNIVGHSTGGLIALLAMGQKPQLFSKAVLLDSVGAKGVKLNPEIEAAFKKMAHDRELTGAILGSTIYNLDPHNQLFNDQLIEDAFTCVKNLKMSVLRALSGVDYSDKIKSIDKSVLVLHGEFDELLPREDSQLLAEDLPNGRFELIANQGHCCNIENPDLFVHLLKHFLNEEDDKVLRSDYVQSSKELATVENLCNSK
jgi:pimeloyl-ACP methyl ester carboxylesterase